MLLSMYLLYRYAKSGKSWSYLVEVGLFVVMVSLVSTLFPVTQFVLFTLPMSFLSFPFYFWFGELRAPPELRYTYPWLPYHSVRFLSVDLNLTPDWRLSGGGIVTGPEFYSDAFVATFLALFLVNVLGGVFGYFVGRRYEFPVLGEERWVVIGVASVVLAFASGVVVNAVFPSGVNWFVVEPVLMSVFGFGVIVVEAVLLSFLVGLAEQARIASLMVLTGLILVLAGGWFSQLVMVSGGWVLLIFGVIIYFAKATVDYLRARESEVSPREQVEE